MKTKERIELVGGRYDGFRLVVPEQLEQYVVREGVKNGKAVEVTPVLYKRTNRTHLSATVYELAGAA